MCNILVEVQEFARSFFFLAVVFVEFLVKLLLFFNHGCLVSSVFGASK